MTTNYAAAHARALAAVAKKGAAVTFTLESPGTNSATDDSWTNPATTTVTGKAIEDEGDPETYRALELIDVTPSTLFFVPTTFGQLPPLNSIVNWAGANRSVKAVFPLRPDGRTIAARVIVV